MLLNAFRNMNTFIVVFAVVITGVTTKTKNVINLTTLNGKCDEYKSLPISMQNVTLTTDYSRKTLINAVVVYENELPANSFLVAVVIKYKSKESPDSCVSFKTFKFPNVCPLLHVKNQVWTTLTENIEPDPTCPIKKGKYMMRNAYMDLTKSPIPLDAYSYWKLKTKIFTKNNDLLGCFYIEGQILPMRQ